MTEQPPNDADREPKSHPDQVAAGYLEVDLLVSLINSDAFGDLLVCGTCGEIKGRDPRHSDEHVQLCQCVPQEQSAAQPRWENKDFNREWELCCCCAVSLKRSGSKFTPFFCEPCLLRVARLNALCGRCVVPVGRHSLMNQVSVPADADEIAIRAFADQLGAFIRFATSVSSWGREAVLANLERCGSTVGTDVPLVDYLDQAPKVAPSSTEAFRSLVLGVAGAPEVVL